MMYYIYEYLKNIVLYTINNNNENQQIVDPNLINKNEELLFSKPANYKNTNSSNFLPIN